ncbi:hypothetical protein EV122DRAFT_221397 [Schizophyllum commune]
MCPRCKASVNCGNGGLANLVSQHWESRKCKKASAAHESTLDIASFFAQRRLKPAAVPSRAKSPPRIIATAMVDYIHDQSPMQALTTSTNNTLHPPLPGHQHALCLLDQLEAEIALIPSSVAESAPHDAVYDFATKELTVNSAEEAWEVLDPALNRLFGYGATVETVSALVRRGQYGMLGIHRVVKAIVTKYESINGVLMEGKIGLMIKGIRHAYTSTPEPDQHSLPNDAPISPSRTNRGRSTSIEIIGLGGTGPRVSPQEHLCNGHRIVSPGKVPTVGRYPFLRHEVETLPWDVEVRHSEVYVRSHACSRTVSDVKPCSACSNLPRNKRLASIIQQMTDGVPENTPLQYLGIRGLTELTRRKTIMIDEFRLGKLNQARHVTRLEGVVDTQKELIVAIAHGRVARADRILQMCIRRGASAETMLAMVYKAKEGMYHPKNYDEEDDLKGILLWRLGGTRVAGIAHRAFGTPAISTLRQRAMIVRFVPSPAAPVEHEVQANVEAGFGLIRDLLRSLEDGILHAVLMVDEVKIEKRPRWDDKTNQFIGVCRECQAKGGIEFSCQADLDTLFDDIDSGKVHLASEATVGAIGLLSADTRLYSARPVLLSGSCKNENAEAHKVLLTTMLDGVNSRRALTNVRIVAFATDGEARRGKALVQLTFKTVLAPTSPIYPFLSRLALLDLHVGDDDLTVDKDYKHVAFKRIRNSLMREKGVLVLGVYLVPSVLRRHLCDAGHSSAHVESVLNIADKQDVELAYALERDISSLPPADPMMPAPYIETREALRLFGALCHHLTFPYVCVDLTLTEQTEHLSSAAHILLALYKDNDAKGRFLPTPLLIDLMLMIKNFLFCIAKAKVDRPNTNYYAVSNGTDRIETLFGILRTMVGNDCNMDMHQLALRVTGTTEVANILARHPEWDQSPRRLRLPTVSRDGQPIAASADHITPRLWRGDVNVSHVNLEDCWKRGRRAAEVAYPQLVAILRTIDNTPGASILAPFGTLLVHTPVLSLDDEEPADVPSTSQPASHTLGDQRTARDEDDTEGLRELEDAAASDLHHFEDADSTAKAISRTVEIDGARVNKARALAQRFKYKVSANSTDRLKRVADEARFTPRTASALQSELFLESGPLVAISHPIASLLACEGHIFLALGEITTLKLHSKPIEHVPASMLREKSVELSYQLIALRPATVEEDPTLKFDWRTGGLIPVLQTIPGALAMSIDPYLATPIQGRPYYLFDSESLIVLASSLRDHVAPLSSLIIPSIKAQSDFPYRERLGERHSPDVLHGLLILTSQGQHASSLQRVKTSVEPRGRPARTASSTTT